jgi:anti-sigma factor ChrR (cupin superfamily)
VFILALISAAASNPAVTEKGAEIASVRVVRAVEASEEAWRAHGRRKERVVLDERGQKRLLRLIEFE